MSSPKVVFITGAQWVPKSFFENFYKPKLVEYVLEGAVFILGAADGIDTYTQEFFVSEHVRPSRVTIYNKGEKDGRLCTEFGLKNGFQSYPERDQALSEDSDTLFAVLPQMGGGQSGVMQSVLQHYLKDGKKAAEILAHVRECSEPYDIKLFGMAKKMYEQHDNNKK